MEINKVKKVMNKVLFIFVLLFLNFLMYSQIFCQIDKNTCNCEVERIINTFNNYRGEYINVLKASIKESFYRNINLDEFTYYIQPILKLNKKATKYKPDDNICKYFDLDTFYFGCKAGVFLGTTLVFYCILDDDNCGTLRPGGHELPFRLQIEDFYYHSSGDYNLYEYWYLIRKNEFMIDSTYQLIFSVKGFNFKYFVIRNNDINIYNPINYEPQVDDNMPNEYIKKMYRPEDIRKIAASCNSDKHSVWWHFWEWFE